MYYPEIIVSLTSYPPRIDTVADMLLPLFRQTVTPDHILLWLPSAEFEGAGKKLPEDLLSLERQVPFFEIRWTETSLRSHNKYFWTMQECPEALVITVDDDLVFGTTLVQQLLNAHYIFPEATISSRSHIVTLGADGEIAAYKKWVLEQTRFLDVPRFDLLATNGAGSLFPPYALPAEAFDTQTVEETCLLADDLWLMVWNLLQDRPIVATGSPKLRYIPNTQDIGLYKSNLDQSGNDTYLSCLFERFPQFHTRLHDEVFKRVSEDTHVAADANVTTKMEQTCSDPSLIQKITHHILSSNK